MIFFIVFYCLYSHTYMRFPHVLKVCYTKTTIVATGNELVSKSSGISFAPASVIMMVDEILQQLGGTVGF